MSSPQARSSFSIASASSGGRSRRQRDNAARHSKIVEGVSERARQGLDARLDLQTASFEAFGRDCYFHMHHVFVMHAFQILSGDVAIIVNRPHCVAVNPRHCDEARKIREFHRGACLFDPLVGIGPAVLAREVQRHLGRDTSFEVNVKFNFRHCGDQASNRRLHRTSEGQPAIGNHFYTNNL